MLDLARQQLDENWALREEQDGEVRVPYKRFDAGWTDYRKAAPQYPVYLWTMSMADEDLERIDRIPKDHNWNQVIIPKLSGTDKKTKRNTKHYIGNTQPWFQFIRGLNPDYPQKILDANVDLVAQQLDKMRSEAGNPYNWANQFSDDDFSSIHIWQEMCPIYMESLVQLTLGGPMHISHGGLQHARVRYYDADAKRPGLPESVAALVSDLTSQSVSLELVNTSQFDNRSVIIQAGTFGEHQFKEVYFVEAVNASMEMTAVNHKWLQVDLPAGTGVSLLLIMNRYVNAPSYDMPWADREKDVLLEGRKP